MQLREFLTTDADAIATHANNPQVAKYLREIFPSPYALDDAQWWVNEGCKFDGTCNRAIVINDQCIGTIGATFGKAEHQFTAEIGYWIGQDYWGRGIVSKAVKMFTRFLFSSYDLKRVFAPVAHENVASIAVLRKCGFVCEGVFHNNMYLRGEFYDEHVYAIYP